MHFYLLLSLFVLVRQTLSQSLTALDTIDILGQLNLHQALIDAPFSRATAIEYLNLFWEEATFGTFSSTRT